MPEVDQLPVIKRLPAQLTNQIAAGEVIERPASVLKELIENALDAKATRIDIELVNGGMEHIAVIDNGHGVPADELPLAISRHATSKIESVDDLLNLHSLGFRGEALASICSVSQWEMISRLYTEQLATKLSYLMPDEMTDIHHAPGTRVSIKQLFYNTPARRKFLRAERTEYRHCDDVIKRMALARFDVGFYVKHNGRQTLRLPAVNDDIGRSRRVAQVCGDAFIRQSLAIDYPHNDMRLWGWVSQPDYSRQSTDLQYFFINGRIIRDRVINHAIRSAYQHMLPAGRHAAYVLHLELDPAVVDVNVHPSKHEVRFRESRRVHDFISRSIRDALQQGSPVSVSISETTITDYRPAEIHVAPANLGEQYGLYQSNTESRFGSLLTVLYQRFAITQQQQHVYLLDLQLAVASWISSQWQDAFEKNEIKSLPLLIPERLRLDHAELQVFKQNNDNMKALGFELGLIEPDNLLIRKIPSLLECYDSRQLVEQLLKTTIVAGTLPVPLHTVLSELLPDYKKLNLNLVFSAVEHADDNTRSWRELRQEDLNAWLSK